MSYFEVNSVTAPKAIDYAAQAWGKGSYASAVGYGVSARIMGVAELALAPFRIVVRSCLALKTIVNNVSLLFDLDIPVSKICLTALKIIAYTALLNVFDIVHPVLTIISPELFLQYAQIQKCVYSAEICHALALKDCDPLLQVQTLRIGVLALFGHLGVQLYFDDFRSEFLNLWSHQAMVKNRESRYGQHFDEDDYSTYLQNAFSAHITRQLDTLLEMGAITPALHQQLISSTNVQYVTMYAQQVLLESANDVGALGPTIIPRSDTKVTLGKLLFEQMKEASKELRKMADRFTDDEIEGMYPAPYNAVIGLAIIRMMKGAKVDSDDAITITIGSETLTLDSETEDKDMKALGPRLIELKQLMEMLPPAALEVLTDRICSPDDGDAARKAILSAIEANRKALEISKDEESDPAKDTTAKQEKRAFNLVNELVNTMNRRIIQTKYLPDNQTLPWAEAFLPK